MTKLHAFTNGADYAIAENVDEAIAMLPYPSELWDDDEADRWTQEPDDGKFSIWLDSAGGVAEHFVGDLIERTWAEWIEHFGRGYLCTTEY